MLGSWSSRPPGCAPPTPRLVEEVDNDVVLLHAQAVEVPPHRVAQLIFGLPPELLGPCDCGRVEADAPRLGEDPFVVLADEGGRRLEAVGSAVTVEDVPLKGGPLQLFFFVPFEPSASRTLRASWRRQRMGHPEEARGLPTPGLVASCALAVESGA